MVTESEKTVRAGSAEHLKQLLQEDHRYIFTLIQKFRIERGKIYPKLSDRSDIIVITDEAHRSQYDIFAQNNYYDSLFLAAAQEEEMPLLTLDRKLYEKVKAKRDVHLV